MRSKRESMPANPKRRLWKNNRQRKADGSRYGIRQPSVKSQLPNPARHAAKQELRIGAPLLNYVWDICKSEAGKGSASSSSHGNVR